MDNEKELREQETIDPEVEIHTDPPEVDTPPWKQTDENGKQDDEA